MKTNGLESFDSLSESYGIRAWVVCLTSALFFFYEFVQMSMFNGISADLMATFNINAAQFGNLSAAYFYVDVLFLLPAGIILDRMSTKRLIVAAMTLCVACTYIFAFSSSYYVAMAARGLTGLGSAFCLLSCLKLASRWFPPRRMALITGLVVTMAMLGGMIAQTPFTILAHHIGWREALMVNATVGVLLIGVILLCVRDFPVNYRERFRSGSTAIQELPLLKGVKSALANPQVWLAGFYTSLINLPVFLLGQTWSTLYLQQVHGFSAIRASNAALMLFVGLIIGSPVFGWLSDRMGRRKPLMIIGAILPLITMLVLMYQPNPSYPELLALFLLLGFFISSQIIGYPVVSESTPRCINATALGVASLLIMAGGFTEPFFGALLDLNWNHLIVANVHVYSASNYHLAMWTMPIAFILALFCALGIRETYCRRVEE